MSSSETDAELVKRLCIPPDTPKYCKRPPVFAPAIASVTHDTVIGGSVTVYDTIDWFDIKPSALYVRPVDKPYTDIGEWWVQKLTLRPDTSQTILYRSFDGYIQEEYDSDGNLRKQDWLNRDMEPDESIANWTMKEWHSNGRLAFKGKHARAVLLNSDSTDNSTAAISYNVLCLFDEAGSKIVSGLWYDPAGNRTQEQAYVIQNHSIIIRMTRFYPDGRRQSVRLLNPVTGLEQSTRINEPSCVVYSRAGKPEFAQYKVFFNDTTVLHRTDGPAMVYYSNRPGGSDAERFYLAGKRYTKGDWSKQVSTS